MATAQNAISLSEYFALQESRYTDVDAAVIGPELERLGAAGKVTTNAIVDAARNFKSPLHHYFEWSDEKAAKLYRNDQAREMAQSIMVRVQANGTETVRRAIAPIALVRVVESQQNAARPRQPARPAPAAADVACRQAVAELEAWRLKWQRTAQLYPVFAEKLEPVFDSIDAVRESAKK